MSFTLTPVQIGVPGAPELLIVSLLVAVPALVAYWVYCDAIRRNSRFALNWAISTFLFGVLGFLPMLVGLGLYVTVREEFEPASGSETRPASPAEVNA